MSKKLIRVSEEIAKTLQRWDTSSLGSYSIERKKGPRYFTAVQDSDGWDIITYYVDYNI